MKRFPLVLLLAMTINFCEGQLLVTPGTQWVNSGSVVIIMQDMNLVNNGRIVAGNSLVKFTGSVPGSIGGDTASSFHDLELVKTGAASISLMNDINVNNRVIFTSGLLDLNQHDLALDAFAYLQNENENSRITGATGGEVIITLPMNAPAASNPGNLGAIISSAANLGTVTLKRGHRSQSGSGLSGSIQRYFDITPANNSALDATLRFHYFDAELNGQSELVLEMYKGNNSGTNWMNQGYTSRDAALNFVEKAAVQHFLRWTLSSTGGPLPVTGLEFFAKRINSNQVQLNWSTKQEFNNKGFHVERKKANENNFVATGFVNTLAPGGNSNLPLQYSRIDNNGFSGISYYRLKQEDMDGKHTYSVIRFVNGTDVAAGLRVWPVPSNGDVNVLLMNIGKDILQVVDVNGRIVQQMQLTDNVQQRISGLPKGTYFIRLAGEKGITQKIIIQ